MMKLQFNGDYFNSSYKKMIQMIHNDHKIQFQLKPDE